MTDADIYRKAAELIDKGLCRACCGAIYETSDAIYYEDSDAFYKFVARRDLFLELFYPPQDGYYYWPDFTADSQEQRVLALLLMAAISENP